MSSAEKWEDNATIDMIHACEGLSLREINSFRFVAETARCKGLDLEDLAVFLQIASDRKQSDLNIPIKEHELRKYKWKE